MEIKRCFKCGEIKPISEFSKDKKCKDGLNSWCKECYSEYSKNWCKEHKEEVRIKRHKRYKKHDVQIRENSKKWRKANPEKIREANHRWRKANPEKIREHSKTYIESSPSYFKDLLIQTGFSKDEITPELIEKKSDIIKTRRLIKQINNKLNNR